MSPRELPWPCPNVVPGMAPVAVTLARTEETVVAVTGIRAYPAGFGFTLQLRLRGRRQQGREFLMASRRLNSDRFFTSDYTPEVYTKFGLNWVEQTTMRDVLLRHHRTLEPALAGVKNAFRPWAHPTR